MLGLFLRMGTIHQTFQVPKMEVLSLIRLFWGWVFPYISLTYCLYSEYLHFRYLKCLVNHGTNIVGWKMDHFDSSCISAKHGIFLPASHLSLPEAKST